MRSDRKTVTETTLTPEQKKAKRRANQAQWQRGYAARNPRPKQGHPKIGSLRSYSVDDLVLKFLNAVGGSPKEDRRPYLKRLIQKIQKNAFEDGVSYAVKESLIHAE